MWAALTCMLGIGNGNHIGFNESRTRHSSWAPCVDLKEETIEANKRFFDGNADLVPKQAYTMGIKTIMQGPQGPDGRQRQGQGRHRQRRSSAPVAGGSPPASCRCTPTSFWSATRALSEI